MKNVDYATRGRIFLIDDPLSTENRPYLEKILSVCLGFKFLEAVLSFSVGGPYGVPSNNNGPLGRPLPGGKFILSRYRIEDIKRRYDELKL